MGVVSSLDLSGFGFIVQGSGIGIGTSRPSSGPKRRLCTDERKAVDRSFGNCKMGFHTMSCKASKSKFDSRTQELHHPTCSIVRVSAP